MNTYLGEIRLFAGSFAPRGWVICDGRELPISQYEALFALLGTIYGGDGRSTFKLPDLRARVPRALQDTTHLGKKAGRARTRLTEAHIPAHTHQLNPRDTNVNLGFKLKVAMDGTPTNVAGSDSYIGGDANHPIGNRSTTAKIFKDQATSFKSLDVFKAQKIDFKNNPFYLKSGNVAEDFSIVGPCLGLNYIINLQGTYAIEYE